MKLKELKENFDNFFKWNKEEIKENYNEIEELIDKLHEKRNSLEKKLKIADDEEEKTETSKKLHAVKKLIKKAKKDLAI